jgi:hypothetical protein
MQKGALSFSERVQKRKISDILIRVSSAPHAARGLASLIESPTKFFNGVAFSQGDSDKQQKTVFVYTGRESLDPQSKLQHQLTFRRRQQQQTLRA